MKLMRVGPLGLEKPALLHLDGSIRDLSSNIPDLAGNFLSDETMGRLRSIDPERLPVVLADVRIGACVGAVGKFVCVGLNYSDHAAEMQKPVPLEPILFMKATSAISGPNDPVIIPRGSIKPDWEVELGVVIGKEARYVDERDALDHVAGFCVVNDVSDRHFQTERGGEWTKGKSADTFGPIGPWLVTRDEIADTQALGLWLDVDGKRYQDGTTASMIFPVPFVIHYISQFMSLQPGDIVSTGSPKGSGMGRKPPVWLHPGNVMRLGVTGLGEQTQRVLPFQ